MAAKGNKTNKGGQLRIIGGQWRSRRLNFIDAQGLRPTPDRVRETLFNWLAPYIDGAKVLDCFAGSGALFFEALSRGAAHVLALELNKAAAQKLQSNLQLLNANNAKVEHTDSLKFLGQTTYEQYDVVFLDPPFHRDLLPQAAKLLQDNNWLAQQALIYTESELPPTSMPLPSNWQLLREKHAGQIYYALWQNG